MKNIMIIAFALLTIACSAQQNGFSKITGTLPENKGQEIVLKGYEYYGSLDIAKTKIDSLGNFTLHYDSSYKGIGILHSNKESNFLILNEPSIVFKGVNLKQKESIVFLDSYENKAIREFDKNYGVRDAALSALNYLRPLYKNENILNAASDFPGELDNEINRIHKDIENSINDLKDGTYVKWLIPIRKLIRDMAQNTRYPENIPSNIADFKKIDLNSENLRKSGLIRQLIENYYVLLESRAIKNGVTLIDESVYAEINESTDHIIAQLIGNDELLNKVTDNLFKNFEKKGLFKASEHLSLTILENNQCSLDDNVARKLELYRSLKPGTSAPEIIFSDNTKLSDIKKPILLVFGASWCPHCKNDLTVLKEKYDEWNEKGVEIIYVSIDSQKEAFETEYKDVPWKIFCDFKGWDTKPAEDYYLIGTPTYFLIDKDMIFMDRVRGLKHAETLIGIINKK